ncbi:MAG: RNA methyltransferase, partial [Prevotella sp.]|nr:RNA methyltransferase [Prevotella sp.]
MEENIITSAQNPKIKRLQLLQQKSSERRKSGLFVVEGRRELQHCINAGFEVDTAFVCLDLLEEGYKAPAKKAFEVSRNIYEKIAYRGSTEGIVAEVIARQRTLDDLSLGESPLVVVLESVEKPGNLGAVLRSADAAGADAVIVCDPLTDLY